MTIPALLVPSGPAFCALVVFALVLAVPYLRYSALIDADAFLHARVGADMLASGHLPRVDELSYTIAGKPYVAHEWAYQWLAGMLHRGFGVGGLIWLAATFSGLATWALVRRARARGAGIMASAAGFGVFTLSALYWMRARPHMVSYAGLMIGLAALDREPWKRPLSRATLLAFALGTALWANFHTAVLIFVALVGAELAWALGAALAGRARWDEARRLAGLFAASALGIFLNPYGWRVAGLVWRFLGEGAFSRSIEEHQPFAFPADIEGAGFVIAALVVALFVAWPRLRSRARPGELLGLGVLFVAALLARRNASLFVAAASALVAVGAQEALTALSGRRPAPAQNAAPAREALWLGLPLAAALAVMACLPGPLGEEEQRANIFLPTRAVEAVKAHRGELGERLYNSYSVGSYLVYALPDIKVFVDGRADLYGADFFEEAQRICHGGPEGQRAFLRWNFSWAFLDPSCEPLRAFLLSRSWRELYADELFKVLVAPK